MDWRYQAFISYSHEDSDWALWLMRRLERYRLPSGVQDKGRSRPLSPVFLDREEMTSSPDLGATIKQALAVSGALIVICSPAAVRSQYVTQEIVEFRKLGRANRIYCLIVAGEPNDSANPCFPAVLFEPTLIGDGSHATVAEPLAADVRPHGDGKQDALLKLIAGILELELDVLRRRDHVRQRRRLVSITGASVLGMVFAAMLGGAAIIAERRAEQRQAQAESLLQYMVGDLRESLEPIGRLDLLDGVADAATSYFRTIDAEDLSHEELVSQAEVLMQIGEIHFAQLQYKEALEAFHQANKRNRQLASDNLQAGDQIFQRSQSEYWIGATHLQAGDIAEANSWWRRYRDSAESLIDIDPTRVDWRREVGYGYHNLAIIALKTRDHETAQDYFSLEEQILEDLSSEHPEESSYIADLADTTSWLGNNAYQSGNLVKALDYYQKSTLHLEELNTRTPNNAGLRYWLANALMFEHKMLLFLGRPAEARGKIDRASHEFGELVILDESNGEWALARLRALAGQVELGILEGVDSKLLLSELDDVIQALQIILASETSNPTIPFRLVRSYRLKTQLLFAQGVTSSRELELSIPLSNDLHRALGDEKYIAEVARANLLVGDIKEFEGDFAKANEAWQQAYKVMVAFAEEAQSPEILDPWTQVLLRLGLDSEAGLAFKKLEKTGYRPIAARSVSD